MLFKNNKSLDSIYDVENNLFDLVRFFLASMVIYFHALPLFYGRVHPYDPVALLTKGAESFGSVAVAGFFVISGFLITQSYSRSRSNKSYFLKRALRIMPAMMAAIILGAFIIGPAVSDLGLRQYFSLHYPDNPFSYIINSITFGVLKITYSIRDSFQLNPYPFSINGSMWTLKQEVFWYLMIPLIFIIGKTKKEYLLVILFALFSALTLLSYFNGFRLIGPDFFWFFGSEYIPFIRLSVAFLFGSLLYVYKRLIPANLLAVISVAVLFILTIILGQSTIALLFIMPYLIIVFCLKFKFSAFRKFGDFSYGMYIYAFPIQQTIIFLFKDRIDFWAYVVLSYLSTFILSYISWHLIEAPALKIKKKMPAEEVLVV